jgi:F-type H+-transporting ATPase subunit a
MIAATTTVTEDPAVLSAAHTTTVAGLTFHVDTILATVVAGILVIATGLFVRRRLSAHQPTRAQLAWESVVSAVERQVERSIGPAGQAIVPLAVVLFVFILIASLLETIPSGHPDKALPAPTGDLNLTAALALLVIFTVHAMAIRSRGLRGYLRHYLRPTPWLLPLKVLEEVAKPITLALRLFGNLFAGTVMVILIFELIPPLLAPVPLLAWRLFSVFVAVMQAFLFALLTVLYFQTAMEPDSTSRESPAASLPPKTAATATTEVTTQ